jgi:hypothetical protein
MFMKLSPGVDYTKLFLPSKKLPVPRKYAVQFHQLLKQQISSLIWHTFCKTIFAICQIWAPKKLSPRFHEKAASVC